MEKIRGQLVAVVTGGAGGIGKSICAALGREGMGVVVVDLSADAVRAVAESLPGEGHYGIAVSVVDKPGLAFLASEVRERYGHCDLLVNCVGITRFVPHDDLDGLDDDFIDLMFATNVRGPFATVRALRPLLDKSAQPGGAVVVNITSIAAFTAVGSNVMYCASKAALDNVTKSLARALAPKIRVVAIAPALAETDFIKSMDQRWRDEQLNHTPLRRLAAPDDIASAVIAITKHLTYTTGSTIFVDGGRPLD
jgi:3-oxoacyl-[acyl-carrier protein] reductase